MITIRDSLEYFFIFIKFHLIIQGLEQMFQKIHNYKKLLSYLTFIIHLAFKKYPGMYFLILGSIFSIGIEFLSIYIISQSANNGTIKIFSIPLITTASYIPTIFIGLLIIRFASMFVLESFAVHYAKELQVYFSAGSLHKILHTNLKTIEKKEIGHYTSFAGDEASNASQIIISCMNLFNNAVLIAAYFVLVIIYSFDLLFFIILMLIVIAVLFKKIYQYTFFLSTLQAELRRKNNSVFLDSLNGLRVVKAFSIEDHMANEYKAISHQYFTVNSKLVILSFLGKYLPLVVVLLAYGIYYIFILQHNDILTIGTVIASLFILLRLLNTIGGFASVTGKIIGELKGTMHLVDFLKEQSLHLKIKKLSEKIHHITFRNVSFAYSDSLIFDRLNIVFEQGKSYAIVGQTGSGKSTLLDMIMDFNTPTSGVVYINDIATSELDEKSLADKILYVGQEAIVFNDTVRKNLEIDTHYSDEKIEKSLKTSCLQDTITLFDSGLDYPLQYRGTNISGGQKQRLNLARALLRDPDVLILDESVNALDEKTRHEVVKNIIIEYKDKILIFVTHDKDILSFVDEIIDLDILKESNAQKNN